jgi:hypothetical protein
MNRFRIASEKLSSARRHLITVHPGGDRGALLAALEDVEAGLEALGDTRLVSDAAASSLALLKTLVPSHGPVPEPNEKFEWGAFAGAVDDLATRLYWSEPTEA